MNIITIIWVIFGTGLLYYFLRLEAVSNSRDRIREYIHKHNNKCIKNRTYDIKKISYDLPDKIYTFDEMVFKFWMPVGLMEKKVINEIDKQKVVKRLEGGLNR